MWKDDNALRIVASFQKKAVIVQAVGNKPGSPFICCAKGCGCFTFCHVGVNACGEKVNYGDGHQISLWHPHCSKISERATAMSWFRVVSSPSSAWVASARSRLPVLRPVHRAKEKKPWLVVHDLWDVHTAHRSRQSKYLRNFYSFFNRQENWDADLHSLEYLTTNTTIKKFQNSKYKTQNEPARCVSWIWIQVSASLERIQGPWKRYTTVLELNTDNINSQVQQSQIQCKHHYKKIFFK